MGSRHYCILRIISFVVLFFFSWTFGGLFDIAYAVKISDQQSVFGGQQKQKQKRAEEKLNDVLDDIKSILADTSIDIDSKKNKLKTKKADIDAFDAEIRRQFAETEKKLKDAGLPQKILKRHYDFVNKYEDNFEELKNNLDAIDKAQTDAEVDSVIEKTKTHLKKLKPPKKYKPLNPNKLPHRTSEPVFKEPRTKPEEFGKGSGKILAVSDTEDSTQRSAISDQLTESILVASDGPLTGLLSSESDCLNFSFPLGGLSRSIFRGEDRSEDDFSTSSFPNFLTDETELSDYLLLAQASNLPSSADLAETVEVQFTSAITGKAAELENDPLRIYEWIRNNIEFVPTYGSIQGADYCLQTKQCNAFDTASLLIALLRVSNIHARYVEGTVEIPIEKVMNWLGGFTDAIEATRLLASAGIPITAMIFGGKIKYVRIEHIWVEAWIDYFPSRGSRHETGKGEVWIPLDASFKQYNYTQGIDIQSVVPFDAQSFVDQIQATATINEIEGYVTGVDSLFINQSMIDYQAQVENYINQNYPDATAGDVLGTKEIIPQNFPYLLGTLPYRTIARGGSHSEMPDNLRHKITFNVKKDIYDDVLGTPINVTKSLPELAGNKLTLSYSPATPEDEAVINSYLPDPHPDGTPIDPGELTTYLSAYLINLKPELRVNGAVVATGTPVGMGVTEEFKITFTGPNVSADIISNDIEAGEYMGIGLDLGRISKKQMQAVQTKLEDTKAKLEAQDLANLTKDDILGDLLYTTAISYYAELDVMDYIQAKTMGVIATRLPSESLFSYELKVSKFMDIPVSIEASGLAMDVDRAMVLVKSLDDDTEKPKQFMLASGMNGSALEHAVPEQIFSTAENPVEGISAVKALKIANDQGIPIYTINQTNIDSILPQLQIDGGTIQDIQNAINAGKEVTVSKTDITFNGWTGVGYIIIDPATGAGAYMISGGMSGAWIIVGSLSHILLFLGLVTILSFMGPLGIFLAAALTIGLAINYMNSIGQTIDNLDYGEITPQTAEHAIAAKSMSAAIGNLIGWGIPHVLGGGQALVATLFEIIMFNAILDHGLLTLF